MLAITQTATPSVTFAPRRFFCEAKPSLNKHILPTATSGCNCDIYHKKYQPVVYQNCNFSVPRRFGKAPAENFFEDEEKEKTLNSNQHNTCNHEPITLDLIKLIEEKPEIGRLLSLSIAKANKVNPDLKTNPVRNLQEYCAFADQMVKVVPYFIIEHAKNLPFNTQIDQGLSYFYFLANQALCCSHTCTDTHF